MSPQRGNGKASKKVVRSNMLWVRKRLFRKETAKVPMQSGSAGYRKSIPKENIVLIPNEPEGETSASGTIRNSAAVSGQSSIPNNRVLTLP